MLLGKKILGGEATRLRRLLKLNARPGSNAAVKQTREPKDCAQRIRITGPRLLGQLVRLSLLGSMPVRC